MLQRTYKNQNCSIARALELVGERWTLLIVRDAALGLRRFDEFQRSLGIARNVLSERLARLVESGVFERRRYQERPARYEYVLSPMGRDLQVALLGLRQWGDRYLAEHGPPRLAEHKGCGGAATAKVTCDECGAELTPETVRAVPGPAAALG